MPSTKKSADGSTRTVRVVRNPHSKTFGFSIGEIAVGAAAASSAGSPKKAGSAAAADASLAAVGVLDPGKSTPVGALRAGDVFVSINGVAVAGWSLERVTEEIRKAKRDELMLEVRSPSPSTTSFTGPTAAAAGGDVSAEVSTAIAAINAAEAAAAHAAALALDDSLASTFHLNPGLAGPLAASVALNMAAGHVALNTAASVARAAAAPGETGAGAKSTSLPATPTAAATTTPPAKTAKQTATALIAEADAKRRLETEARLVVAAVEKQRSKTKKSRPPATPTAAATEDCGLCKNCLDKPKFGGPNKKRQACLHPAFTAAATMTPPAETAERNAAKGSGRTSSAKRAATTSKGTASKKTSKTPKGKASRAPAQPAPAAATAAAATPPAKTAEQNRLAQVIKHGSAVILDEFDVTHIPITFDVRTEDPDWYKIYESLVQVRNVSLSTLLCDPGHWSCRQYDTPGLDGWIEDQRSMYADRRAIIRGEPPTDDTFVQPILAKIALLDAIHFVWLPQDRRRTVPIVHGTVLDAISDEEWKSYYDRLIAHTFERGHGIVPSYTELGMWCGMQRARRRGGTLDWTKVQALNALGFDWDGDELSDWYGMRARLAQFKAKFGDCLVMPPREVDDPDEDGKGNSDGEGGKTGSEKQGEETSNGETCGDEEKEEQKKGEEEEKSEDVRTEEVEEEEDWSELWWWVQCQRIERKCTRGCLLTPSHIASLDELDFIWTSDIKAAWIRKFRELKAHHAKHGTFHVPGRKKFKTPLGAFVVKLRAQCQTMQKREEKERLKEEASRSGSAGSAKLPVRDWREFGWWKHGTGTTLTPTAIRLLDSIGFTWESEFAISKLPTWEEKFEELRQYKEKTGNCLVHQKDPSGLGDWVKHMRKMYDFHQQGKASPLNEERIRKLEELGFVWRVRGKRGKGLQKEEALKEAREAWKIAREKRRSMDSGAGGAGSSEAVNHHNVDEQEGDRMKPPRQGGDNRASGKKRKLSSSQEMDESSCEEAARRDMVDALRCRACSNIVIRSTACVPCGHSFCATCIEFSLGQHSCPSCHTDVATLLPLRDVDRIVAITLQRGDFDAKDVDVYKRRSCDWVADHRENVGLI